MTDSTHISTEELETALRAWLPQQRWFAAKGSRIVSLIVISRVPLGSRPGVEAEHVLVDVGLDAHVAEGGRVQRYQVPLGFRRTVVEDLAPWQLPVREGVFVYDGLRDPKIIALYSDALSAAQPIGSLEFRNVPGETVETGMLGRVLGAEQSNTSVVLGEVLLLKLFRQVSPGINPDIELHRALAATGCRFVAPLRAWIETEADGEVSMLGMAQDFVADAAEGWTTALASVRDLLASDRQPAELDSDFSGEAYDLGAAVAHVHADLARELGTAERAGSSTAGA